MICYNRDVVWGVSPQRSPCGRSSVGRARRCQCRCRGFEPLRPLLWRFLRFWTWVSLEAACSGTFGYAPSQRRDERRAFVLGRAFFARTSVLSSIFRQDWKTSSFSSLFFFLDGFVMKFYLARFTNPFIGIPMGIGSP